MLEYMIIKGNSSYDKKLSGFYTVRFTLLQLTVAGSSHNVL